MAQDSSRSKADLLSAARERLSGHEPEAETDTAEEAAPTREIRYRGQVVKAGTGAAPGSGLRKKNSGGPSSDVRAALLQIKQLYTDGLISRAEAERKRSEILDRL